MPMITDDEKSAISASMGMNHMRRRRGGYPVISPNGYRLEAVPESSVISVTEPLLLTSADSGNTYSLDSALARLDLPLRATLTTGWTITVQTTVIGKYATVTGGEVGAGIVMVGGDGYDGISMDSLDAQATIEYTGGLHEVSVLAGTVNGYWD